MVQLAILSLFSEAGSRRGPSKQRSRVRVPEWLFVKDMYSSSTAALQRRASSPSTRPRGPRKLDLRFRLGSRRPTRVRTRALGFGSGETSTLFCGCCGEASEFRVDPLGGDLGRVGRFELLMLGETVNTRSSRTCCEDMSETRAHLLDDGESGPFRNRSLAEDQDGRRVQQPALDGGGGRARVDEDETCRVSVQQVTRTRRRDC